MISKRKYFNTLLSCVCLSFLAVGCSMDERVKVQESPETVTVNGRQIPENAFYQGMVSVKVTEEFAESLATMEDTEGVIDPAAVKSLDGQLSDMKLTKIERTFMHGGKYEQRMRKYGLHLWYNFYLEEGTPLSKAGEGLSSVKGIRLVEYRPLIELADGSEIVYASPSEIRRSANAATDYFNDPGLERQWHYYNDGTVSKHAKAGSDINVLPVWKEGVVGSPDVIVAVMDEGIYWNHEDLIDNVWTGTDEEGNEIHGYNFCNMNYAIDADEHGTHVAGTIAAVNNNGIGVSGVAGGDKGRGIEGAKVMSCQILKNGGAPDDGKTAPRFSEALVWAANHGAVISQNSWSHSLSYSQYDLGAATELDKEGMRYFIECAGMDETGENQDPDSPMAGGVIFFAAANDYHTQKAVPAMFDECITVAAIKSDYQLPIYSNMGKWVDISAPGGDTLSKSHGNNQDKGYYQSFDTDAVYSTVPPDGNGVSYAYKNGTSMACPHVSGVAALIISKFGGPGFTNDELRAKLLTTTTYIDPYNPEYEGLMGVGLVNAANAVLGIESVTKPSGVSDFEAVALGDNIRYSFTVPAGDPRAYYIVVSEKEMNKDTYGAGLFTRIELDGYASGDMYEGHHATGLFDNELYVGVLMIGANGEVSELSNVQKVQTSANNAPTIEPLDGTEWTVYNNRTETFRFKVVDPDEHILVPQLTPSRDFVTYSYEHGNEIFEVYIDGAAATPGEYKLRIRMEDPYDEKAEVNVKYTVLDEPAPEEPSEPSDPSVEPQLLTFFPNPVVDNLYIRSLDGTAEESGVTVYSATGAVAIETTVTAGGSDPIDMSALPAGVYSVKVVYMEQVITSSVVKL